MITPSEHVIGGGIFLGLAGAGMAAGGAAGALNFSLVEIATVSLFAGIGAVARTFLDAKAARDKAAGNGTPKDKLPTVDLISLGYALLAAPFVGSVAMFLIESYGAVPDYGAAFFLMGGGYLGRDIVSYALGILEKFLPGGGKKDGP